jgi:hypothetical protein
MEKLIGSTPGGMGLATTAILGALLERLISSEGRNDLEPYKSIVSFADAIGVVGKLAAGLRQIPVPPA